MSRTVQVPLAATPLDAAEAVLAFWTDAANTALQLWANATHPAIEGQRMAVSAGSLFAPMPSEEPDPERSWYRAPIGVQDSASGAVGYLAGPWALMMPAFTANPFWPAATGPRLAEPIGFAVLAAAMGTNPWARVFAHSMPHDVLRMVPAMHTALEQSRAAFAMPAEIAGPEPFPAYQSDSGHAVAQIIRTGANALVAILPILAFLVGLVVMAGPGAGVGIGMV